jgi:hypothetical protein
MYAQITGIILSWKRPANVARIVDGWRDSGLLAEGIVWNNNPDEVLHHDWAKVINAQQNFGVYPRFAAACLAQNECILIQDDDLEMPRDSLRALHEFWEQDPAILHGVFGRAPKPDGSYAMEIHSDGEAPIVLTRVLFTQRRYVRDFFRVAEEFEEIQRGTDIAQKGEDIIFSYVAMRHSGRLNRIHQLPVVELPAPHSIHGRDWQAHLAHRTCVLRACEAWLHGRPPS